MVSQNVIPAISFAYHLEQLVLHNCKYERYEVSPVKASLKNAELLPQFKTDEQISDDDKTVVKKLTNAFNSISDAITEALEVSLEYLKGNIDLLLEKNVLNKIMDIQKMVSEDRAHVFFMLNAFLQSHKTKKVFAS